MTRVLARERQRRDVRQKGERQMQRRNGVGGWSGSAKPRLCPGHHKPGEAGIGRGNPLNVRLLASRTILKKNLGGLKTQSLQYFIVAATGP